MQSLDEEIQEFQDAVSSIEDEVFADFCQRLGFDDIRQYESSQGRLQQEAAQKKLEFKWMIEWESSMDWASIWLVGYGSIPREYAR